MKACNLRRAGIATLCTCALAVLSGGCDSDRSSDLGAGSSTPSERSSSEGDDDEGDGDGDQAELKGVRATVAQQRIDEGTRRIGRRVSVGAEIWLHVVAVQLNSSGFETIPATSKDTVFAPGQAIDLTTVYGEPLCDNDPTKGLSAGLTVQDPAGTTRTYQIPVSGNGIGLIRRLHAAECAQMRLRQAASVSYTNFRRARIDGDEVLSGALQFERPDNGGSGEVVTIDSLSGSVLFDFRQVAGRKPRFVARLGSSADQLRLPVRIGSSGRCDQHARSQSSQTFLFSAYVRVGAASEHREILIPPPLLQRQALALLDDVC